MSEKFDPTDVVLARKLAEIAPPVDLRARLLAADPSLEKHGSRVWWARGIAAAAAAMVLAFVVLSLDRRGAGEPLAAATSDLAAFLTNRFQLELKSSDPVQIRAWLAAHNPKHPIDLPAALAGQRPIGCREMIWRDHRGSLACFSLSDEKEAHLAMFPTKTFADPPGNAPVIAQAGKWTSASWSRDGMTYLLFVPEGMDPIKELLAVTSVQRIGKMAWRD